MSQVETHYDTLLAAHYSWMNGMPLSEKVIEQRAILTELGVGDGPKRLAIDLGCGPGYQSFALVDLGFEAVIALDTSRTLIDELEAARGDRAIRTVLADMRSFATIAERGSADAIVCMGDTLTHLDRKADVTQLFRDAYDMLGSTGRLALTFRDLSGDLTGLDRFLPVRADDERIMICALDYEPETVIVNDLVHVRGKDGWVLHKSSYRKLRLKPSILVTELKEIGFSIDHDRTVGRMHAIVARKP